MAGAAETILAIGQQQARSMEFLSNAISNGFGLMSKAEKDRGDAHEQIFRSALQYKQQEIDTFFKQKQLELAGKELELDSTYKAGMLDYHMKSLDANLEEARIRAEALNKGKENKGFADIERVKLAANKAKSLEAQNRLKYLSTRIESAQFKIENSPQDLNSATEELEKLTKERERIEKEWIGYESNIGLHFSRAEALDGGVPLSELDKITSDSQSSSENSSNNYVSIFRENKAQTEDGMPAPIESSAVWSSLFPSVENDKEPVVAGERQSIIPPTAPVAKPVEAKPNTLSLDKILPFVNHKNPAMLTQAIKLADPDAKKKIDQIIDVARKQVLISQAQAKNLDFSSDNKAENPIAAKVLEKAQEQYTRFGGDVNQLASDVSALNTFITTINTASSTSSDPEMQRLYLATRDSDGAIIPSKLNDEINNKINELTKAPEPESIFKGGNGSIGDLDGGTGLTIRAPIVRRDPDLPSRNINNPSSRFIQKEKSLIKKYDEKSDVKSRDDLINEFSNNYVKDGKIDYDKVAQWINGEKGLTEDQLGVESFEETTGGGFSGDFGMGTSKRRLTKREINQKREEKIRSLSQEELMNLYATYNR